MIANATNLKKKWTGNQGNVLLDGNLLYDLLQNSAELFAARKKADPNYHRHFQCLCGLILTKPCARIFMFCPFCHKHYTFYKGEIRVIINGTL